MEYPPTRTDGWLPTDFLRTDWRTAVGNLVAHFGKVVHPRLHHGFAFLHRFRRIASEIKIDKFFHISLHQVADEQ